MEKYTIYCTEEQTKKAHELGAPINRKTKTYYICTQPSSGYEEEFEEATDELIIPTTEQMIGWMEEQNISFQIMQPYNNANKWIYYIRPIDVKGVNYTSRKEATLAAIDAALDYLTNKED